MKIIPQKEAKKSAIFLVCLSFLALVFYGWYRVTYVVERDMAVSADVVRYKGLDKQDTDLASRKWLNYAMSITKRENYPPAGAARFYAYVTAAYADTLEATGSTAEAGVAARDVLNGIAPKYKEQTQRFFTSVVTPPVRLSIKGEDVVEKLLARSQADRFDRKWDKQVPKGSTPRWFIRDNRADGAAKAGEWLPWILSDSDQFTVPAPPAWGGLEDITELTKVRYATLNRKESDLPIIYFWHGASGFVKGQAGDNITPAGVWQDILYAETGKTTDDPAFAKAQKILAQAIADSFIVCWRVKYEFWTQRPSMRIGDLDLAVGDPPFPSYVSGHSTISHAAAVVLTDLFPEKREVWFTNAKDARNSRLLGGIHYNVDNEVGAALGLKVGAAIVNSLHGKGTGENPKTIRVLKDNPFNLFVDLVALTVENILHPVTSTVKRIAFDYFGPRPGSTFKNVASEAGVAEPGHGGGAAWGDYDNDGWLDLYATSSTGEGNRLYRNLGNGRFEDKTSVAGVSYTGKSQAAYFADYNNDGCQDLYVVNYPNEGPDGAVTGHNMLFRNQCNGIFSDVTAAAGVANAGMHSYGAAWGDYDRDGYLDLFVASYGYVGDDGKWVHEFNSLFHNGQNGVFTEVAAVSGVSDVSIKRQNPYLASSDPGLPFSAIWFDYDSDGWQDLFVASDIGVSALYKNNKDSTFADVTESAGLDRFGTAMGVTVADYDDDGDFDLYVTNADENYFWRNNGNATFTEVAHETGTADSAVGWGVGFADYDNDGDDDIVIANGATGEKALDSEHSRTVNSRSALYEQVSPGKFVNLAKKTGAFAVQISKAAAFADYDNNGFTDFYATSLDGPNRLYQNKGNANHYLTLVLTGTKSNRNGLGSVVTVKTGGSEKKYLLTGGGSFKSGNAPWLTIGLGSLDNIESLSVAWPSGVTQELINVKANEKLEVKEPLP